MSHKSSSSQKLVLVAVGFAIVLSVVALVVSLTSNDQPVNPENVELKDAGRSRGK